MIESHILEFGKKFTFIEFCENYKAITSRTFKLFMDPENPEKKTATIVQFGHLLNHMIPQSVEWKWQIDEKGRDGWFAYAIQDIESG